MYKRITKLRKQGTAVLLAIGGWTDSSGEKYSKMVSSGSSRRAFINSAVAFLRRHEFSGLSLEWNHPVCWQADCSKGPQSDSQNYAKLVQVSAFTYHYVNHHHIISYVNNFRATNLHVKLILTMYLLQDLN